MLLDGLYELIDFVCESVHGREVEGEIRKREFDCACFDLC